MSAVFVVAAILDVVVVLKVSGDICHPLCGVTFLLITSFHNTGLVYS